MAIFRIGLVALVAWSFFGYARIRADHFAQNNAFAQNNSVKQVMRKAHKQGLLKQVLIGDASDADRRQLLGLYQDLAANRPPRGEMRSWRAKTSAIVNAANAVVQRDPNGIAALKNAVNCAACHKAHKE